MYFSALYKLSDESQIVLVCKHLSDLWEKSNQIVTVIYFIAMNTRKLSKAESTFDFRFDKSLIERFHIKSLND